MNDNEIKNNENADTDNQNNKYDPIEAQQFIEKIISDAGEILSKAKEQLENNIAFFDNDLKRIKDTFSSDIDTLLSENKTLLNTEINALKDQLESSIEDIATSKTNDLLKLSHKIETNTQKLSSLEDAIEKRSIEVNAQIAQWQSQFATAQESRNSEFANANSSQEQRFANLLSNIKSSASAELNAHKEQLISDINSVIADIQLKHETIRNLYELVGEDSVSGGYKKVADTEDKKANQWKWLSFIVSIITALWLCYVFVFSGIEDPVKQWHKIMLSLSITGVLLYSSAYASSQSNKHRATSREMRWFALQVTAFDPFVNSLEKEQRDELKKAVTAKLFGSRHTVDEKENPFDQDLFTRLPSLLKSLGEFAKNIK